MVICLTITPKFQATAYHLKIVWLEIFIYFDGKWIPWTGGCESNWTKLKDGVKVAMQETTSRERTQYPRRIWGNISMPIAWHWQQQHSARHRCGTTVLFTRMHCIHRRNSVKPSKSINDDYAHNWAVKIRDIFACNWKFHCIYLSMYIWMVLMPPVLACYCF